MVEECYCTQIECEMKLIKHSWVLGSSFDLRAGDEIFPVRERVVVANCLRGLDHHDGEGKAVRA